MNRIRISRGAGVGEPIHVWPSHGSTAPEEFVWRGRRYRVRALQAAHGELATSGVASRRFHVRTTNGLACVLAHDADGDAWRMDRVISSGGGR
ncbi:MAG TPA: DUF6504 family protein [Anaerolineales bacterium]|nr:DUF6504 family protein [Anaerolineales bacterium]